jgi:hypothetical protein
VYFLSCPVIVKVSPSVKFDACIISQNTANHNLSSLSAYIGMIELVRYANLRECFVFVGQGICDNMGTGLVWMEWQSFVLTY